MNRNLLLGKRIEEKSTVLSRPNCLLRDRTFQKFLENINISSRHAYLVNKNQV